MVAKIFRAIPMRSLSSLSFVSLLLLLTLLERFRREGIIFSLFPSFLGSASELHLGIIKRPISLIFLVMLSIVSVLVYSYSEAYMEHYNNKKFLTLLFLFVLSIIFLSVRFTSLPLIIGWDYLGLTSLCLIIIYPNKFTKIYSFLTIIFNRVGDVAIIVFICFLLLSLTKFHVFPIYFVKLCMVRLLICLVCKRAQFPISSWLPAAIAAPTPISAIVHSSTLVTAGVLLAAIFIDFIRIFILSPILLVLSSLSFLSGGSMASVEPDLKKTIAFSTISQIRIMIIFICLSFNSISMCHILYHASFKRLLFCCAGTFFSYSFMSQYAKNSRFSSGFLFLPYTLLFISCFGMTGLIISSSFFTKDVLLELLHDVSYSIFILILFSSAISIFYIGKLLESGSQNLWSFRSACIKSFGQTRVTSYGVFCLGIGALLRELLISSFCPSQETQDFLCSLLVLATGFYTLYKIPKLILIVTSDILLIKTFSFSLWSHTISNNVLNPWHISDHFFFKPYAIFPYFYRLTSGSLYGFLSLAMLIFVLGFYSNSLHRTWHWSCQSIGIKGTSLNDLEDENLSCCYLHHKAYDIAGAGS